MSFKSLIVYSSVTGNTKQVAEAIAEALAPNADIHKVEDNPSTEGYDLVAVGYWVDKGSADAKATKYLQSIKNTKVAIFATLGAEPDSQHALDSLQKGRDLLDSSNEVVGDFICQGKIDPKIIAFMAKHFGTNGKGFHAVDEKRKQRHIQASTHPDAQDLANAKARFSEIKQRLTGGH